VKKTFVAVALAVIFVLAIAAPAFAIVHIATYDMDGDIYMDKQVGHFCNTGAEQLQTIRGTGKMTKSMTVMISAGKVDVDDKNDFVTAPDAVSNLVVTSVITLCTPPKFTYTGPGWFDAEENYEFSVHPSAIYDPGYGASTPRSFFLPSLFGFTGYGWDEVADWYGWDAVSEQIWAARVEANPGFSGNLHQDWEAAYGGFWGGTPDTFGLYDFEDPWTSFGGLFNQAGKWRWETDEDGILGAGLGKKFVGDYFKMTQMARTSDGDVKRYIDISSPWTGAYLYEDFEVAGFAEIMDSFTMINLPAGEDMPGDWWKDLFDK
jgi:hypothetical protein